MTEDDWLNANDGKQLSVIQEHASIRKLRLIAASFVRQWQSCPDADEAKHCDDLIEIAAENPSRWEDFQEKLEARPGNWRFTHILFSNELDDVVKNLRKLVVFAPIELSPSVISLIYEIVGNPFRPVTLTAADKTPTIVSLARAAYDERYLPSGELDPHRLAVLADALEESGAPGDLLEHIRSPGPHVRGCFAIDLILGLS